MNYFPEWKGEPLKWDGYITADFETTTDPEDCRVWHWGIRAIFRGGTPDYADAWWGRDIESFMHCLETFTCRGRKKTLDVFFHNLKFDGDFICNHLLRRGFKYKKPENRRDPQPEGTFSTLITDGSWYFIQIGFKSHTVKIMDSLKKINMSIEAAAKAFEAPMVKGEIDYEKPRPVGYSPTPEELDYLYGDISIAATAMRQVLESGMKNLTVASDSFADWKRTCKESGKGRLTDKRYFRARYPVIENDADLRKAYRGGWTIAIESKQKMHMGPGMTFDVNSLYPSVMYDRPIPFDQPFRLGKEIPTTPFWIGKVRIEGTIKDNCPPCFPTKSKFGLSYEYGESFHTDVWCTGVDYNLWNDMYDMHLEDVFEMYGFRVRRDMFKPYIDKWMAVKESSTGGKRTLAKLHLNSLYGKFATRTEHAAQIPELSDKGALLLQRGEVEVSDPVYTPAACFITAWARDVTVRAAAACGDRFCYADTDSIHITGTTPPPGLDVHPTRLGAWKHESTWSDAVFGGAKRYAELIDGVWDKHVAGMPEGMRDMMDPDDLITGRVFTEGKLVPKHVPGGQVLVPTPFTLK